MRVVVRTPPALVGSRGVNLVQSIPGNKRVAAAIALVLLAVLVLSAANAPSASAACPTFRVLHNDRIGAANLPAGTYDVTPTAGSGLTCAQSSALFTRFLQDWDGDLARQLAGRQPGLGPRLLPARQPHRVHRRPDRRGRRRRRQQPHRPALPQPVQGEHRDAGRPAVYFDEGNYLIYLPTGSGITCRRASVLFTRFLGQPGGRLPFPWHVRNQTATFFSPNAPSARPSGSSRPAASANAGLRPRRSTRSGESVISGA